jgi:hypothetical protein
MCLERRLARHCNMVTQQRDHATRRSGLIRGRIWRLHFAAILCILEAMRT